MQVEELLSMFPSLNRGTIDRIVRAHPGNEDAVITALLQEVETKGGVGSSSSLPVAASSPAPPRLSISPLPQRHQKVLVPSHGNVPDYFDSFWKKHGSEFAPLKVRGDCLSPRCVDLYLFIPQKEDASKALFFDKHFTETSEQEGESLFY